MGRARVCCAAALLFCTAAAAQQIGRIGHAVVALTGPWKFHIGDDPRWAGPDFDDAGWEKVDLTPKGARDYYGGFSDYVPGWTTLGHPGYSGYAWYRLTVQIEQTHVPLALLMPLEIDDGYQIYANGQEIGQFGDLTRRPPVLYITTAEWFRLPAEATGQTTFAIRFYMLPATLSLPDAGGMHGPPRVGAVGAIAALGGLARQRFLMAYASNAVEFVLYIGFAFALFALYCLDRTETVYLWFTCAYVALALTAWIVLLTIAVPDTPAEFTDVEYVLASCWVGCLMAAWWRWFGLNDKRWLIRLMWIAVLARTLGLVCGYPPLMGGVFPLSWSGAVERLAAVTGPAIGLLFAVLAGWGMQRQGREGWVALPAVLLFPLSFLGDDLARLHVPTVWSVSGSSIHLGQIGQVMLAAVLGALIIRRFQRSQRRKQQLEEDLRQAQQVQRVLLPQEIPQIAGFRIECEYRPAQEVGGDFFQVLETRDNGLLVVMGDVSGKGVRAAMLVALIVGTLRTIVEEAEEPRDILVRLNGRLCGRMEGGFATCLCARITPDGMLSVANAGHLAPWLDGSEIALPNDLPLGIAKDVEYGTCDLKIPESSTLTFISDGVVEAKNGERELFGFERAQEMSMRPAAEIAEAAKQFGQEDDITVLRIQRIAVPVYA